MTEDQMLKAGTITQQLTYSNEDLLLALKGTRLALAYLRGKGSNWGLAINPLIEEEEQLKNFARYRNLEIK